MRLRSFTAETVPEAMRRVRAALGPDAVILSTQPAEEIGQVRVTAALEDTSPDDMSLDPAPLGTLSEVLAYHRVPPGLFERLIAAATRLPANDAVTLLAGALKSELAYAPLPTRLRDAERGRPIMLIGPPGAGKTATGAKLCARALLSGAKPGFITLDAGKSGGLAQATAFAEALKIRIEPAAGPDALAGAVQASTDCEVLIIDTPGANPFDAGDLAQLSRATEAGGADPVLVLAAGGDPAECADTAAAFSRIGAGRLIVTKVDAARRLGGLLSAAQAGGIALMAVGCSPNIGDRLAPLSPDSLSRLLLSDRPPVGTGS